MQDQGVGEGKRAKVCSKHIEVASRDNALRLPDTGRPLEQVQMQGLREPEE